MGKNSYKEVTYEGVDIPPSIMNMYLENPRVGDKLYLFLTDYYTGGYSYSTLASKFGLSVPTIKKIHDAAVQTTAYVRLQNVLESGVASFADSKFRNIIFDRFEKEYKEVNEEMANIPEEMKINKLDYRKHILSIISKMAQIAREFSKIEVDKPEDLPTDAADRQIEEMKKNLNKPELPKAEVH